MDFVGTGQRLAPTDFARAGKPVGLSEDLVKAVVDVEAAGRGFDSRNRPKILFEPHVFYERLGKGAKRDRAVREGLAYARWGHKPYPKGSDAQYERLFKAMQIDPRKAIESTSWGLPQIMGYNFRDAGYSSPEDMVEAFKTGEREMLRALVNIIDNWQLEDDLAREDQTGMDNFAERYNGKGFRKNRYGEKLMERFKFHKARPDAGFGDDVDGVPTDVRGPVYVPMPKPRPKSIEVKFDDEPEAAPVGKPIADPSPALTRRAQQALKDKGYHEVGIVGSEWGERSWVTLAAWKDSWNARHPEDQLPADRVFTDEIIKRIERDEHRPISVARATAEAKDLPDSTGYFDKIWNRVLLGLGLTTGGTAAVTTETDHGVNALDKVEQLTDGAVRVQSVFETIWGIVSHNWIFTAVVILIVGYAIKERWKKRKVEKFRTGELVA